MDKQEPYLPLSFIPLKYVYWNCSYRTEKRMCSLTRSTVRPLPYRKGNPPVIVIPARVAAE